MRLAVVTSYFPIASQPHRGHSAYQTLREMTAWSEIRAFCPMATYPSVLRPRNFSYVRADPNYSPPGIPTTYIEYPALPFLSRPLNGPAAARYLMPHLERYKPDLVLSYYAYPDGYAAVAAARKLGIPAIVGAIGSDLNRIPDRMSERLTRTALRQASFVLTVSDHLRTRAIELGAVPDRTRAVRNGCDTAIFHVSSRAAARGELGLAADAQIVVFVGWISPTKGLTELMDAMIALVPSRPRLNLFCIGEGHQQPELEKRAAQAGIGDHIHFLGRQTSSEIASWLAAADLFCLPSYAEGCPNALVEALACGRAAVATRVGGIPELIDEQNGILCSPRNSVALREALESALDRAWDEEAIAKAAQRGWDQVARETYQICKLAVS